MGNEQKKSKKPEAPVQPVKSSNSLVDTAKKLKGTISRLEKRYDKICLVFNLF